MKYIILSALITTGLLLVFTAYPKITAFFAGVIGGYYVTKIILESEWFD